MWASLLHHTFVGDVRAFRQLVSIPSLDPTDEARAVGVRLPTYVTRVSAHSLGLEHISTSLPFTPWYESLIKWLEVGQSIEDESPFLAEDYLLRKGIPFRAGELCYWPKACYRRKPIRVGGSFADH